jgi:AraC family transcriptional regulator
MISLEEISTAPNFESQLDNKVLYAHHVEDMAITYDTTYTIKYVIQGAKQYYQEDQHVQLLQNQYIILNDENTLTTEVKKGTRGLSLFLSQELITDICTYHNVDGTFRFLEVPRNSTNDDTSSLLSTAARLYEYDRVQFKQHMDHLFLQITESVVLKQLQIDNSFTSFNIIKHTTRHELFKQIILAKEYLHDNIEKNITLNVLSREIGISKYYLHRLFKEFIGCTPLQYLMDIRLEKAKHNLQYTNHNIADIAFSCGFSEAGYFSNTFKKHIGISPSQFRSLR